MNFLGPLTPMADRLTRMASSFRLSSSSGIKTSEPPPPDEVMRALEAIIEAGYGTIKTAFDKVDLNGDGFLSIDELDHALRKQGVTFTKEQITAVIKSGNGSTGLREEKETLSEAEFLAMVRRLRRTQSPERKPKTGRAENGGGRPPWVGPMDSGWDERPNQPRVQLPPAPAPAPNRTPPRAKTPPAERSGVVRLAPRMGGMAREQAAVGREAAAPPTEHAPRKKSTRRAIQQRGGWSFGCRRDRTRLASVGTSAHAHFFTATPRTL